jgi:amidophosphoribosyltransferase
MLEEFREKCGIGAVIDRTGSTNVLQHAIRIVDGLQHRGELGAGIAAHQEWQEGENTLRVHCGKGLVKEVLHTIRYDFAWKTHAAITHTRYATSGTNDVCLTQPFVVDTGDPKTSFALGFNGNIANFDHVKKLLAEKGVTLKRDVDTEAICELLRLELERGGTMPQAIRALEKVLDGCYNLTILTQEGNLYAYRDRKAFRPLSYAEIDGVVAVASEDIAIRKIWGEVPVKELAAGEILCVERTIAKAANGTRKTVARLELPVLEGKERDGTTAHCFFEWIYFANRLSKIAGRSVNTVRYLLGEELANMDDRMPQGTVVVPVPDSSKIAGDGYADKRHLRRVDLLLKNPDIGRTFIDYEDRERKAELKYDIDPNVIIEKRGDKFVCKDMVLIDDSIVRGTTMRALIGRIKKKILLRLAELEGLELTEEQSEDPLGKLPKQWISERLGKIHLRLACPPILHPCYYGIDMKSPAELVARQHSLARFGPDGTLPQEELDALARYFGVDSIQFASIPAVARALGVDEKEIEKVLCMACVTGHYPTPAGRERSQQDEQLYKMSIV